MEVHPRIPGSRKRLRRRGSKAWKDRNGLKRASLRRVTAPPIRRPGAYEPPPAGFVSNDTGPTESPSKPLPDQGLQDYASQNSRMNL